MLMRKTTVRVAGLARALSRGLVEASRQQSRVVKHLLKGVRDRKTDK